MSKAIISFKTPVSAIDIEAEWCLDPKNKKQTYYIARHTGNQFPFRILLIILILQEVKLFGKIYIISIVMSIIMSIIVIVKRSPNYYIYWSYLLHNHVESK